MAEVLKAITPTGLAKIVSELGINPGKGYAVDWECLSPFTQRQLDYA
ncbi:MAG: hypothetical protein R2795_11685 [Saprospiraceae bacterium]